MLRLASCGCVSQVAVQRCWGQTLWCQPACHRVLWRRDDGQWIRVAFRPKLSLDSIFKQVGFVGGLGVGLFFSPCIVASDLFSCTHFPLQLRLKQLLRWDDTFFCVPALQSKTYDSVSDKFLDMQYEKVTLSFSLQYERDWFVWWVCLEGKSLKSCMFYVLLTCLLWNEKIIYKI